MGEKVSNRPLDRRCDQSPRVEVPGFGGERRDPKTGAYHLGNGYRAYSPTLMRFTCPDSLSPFGAGGLNPYAYCAGDPVNRADPSGHLSWQAWMGIGMGVLGLGMAVFTAGASIAAAGGVMAALESASAVGLIVGAAGVVGDVTAIASGAAEDVDPKASAVLGWVSLASGAVGLAMGANAFRAPASHGFSKANPVAMGGPMRLLSPPDRNMYAFADNYKGARRLNVVAHSVQMDGEVRLVANALELEPHHLAHFIENSVIDVPAYQCVRLVSCSTADGNLESFAQKFANAIGKQVKAYEGEVYVSTWDFAPRRFSTLFQSFFLRGREATPDVTIRRLAEFNRRRPSLSILKTGVNYHPHRFNPLPLSPPDSPF